MTRPGTILRFLFTTAALLLLSGAGMHMQAQQESITVQGVITDEFGEPLPGAAVMLKGSKSGTVADVGGNYKFTFRKPAGKASCVLEFSFLSMETKSVDVRTSGTVNVSLKSDNTLEGVVVNGFYDQSKETFTGVATTIVDANDLNVEILGKSPSLAQYSDEFLAECIRDNPAGQDAQHTPFVRVRKVESEA